MKYPSWQMFQNKYGNDHDRRDQFENLCRILFCRELGIGPETLVAVKNQAGNETEVVLHEGKLIGFQCKYFDREYNFQTFKDSIFKAKKYNKDQDVIYLYSNKKFPSPEKKNQLKDYVSELGMECEPRFDNQITDIVANDQNLYDFFFSPVQVDEKVFRPYENELSVDVNEKFLDDASENLIQDGKLYRNIYYINKVKQYLNDKKFCLIKAPEGRGKTFLSRIVAYDFHHEEKMKVFFLNFKKTSDLPINKIEDEIQKWHRYTLNEYLLVFENVHAYKNLNELKDQIKKCISKKRFRCLLNARPTYVEFDLFSEWEEIVELKPGNEDVNGIISLYSKEVGRAPFKNDEKREIFINKINPKNKNNTKSKITNGANLRLLKIYLETWQNHPKIEFVSDVKEETIINDYRDFYLMDGNVPRPDEEIEALWYISCLFQFDVPLHKVFVKNVGRLTSDGLLRFEEKKYHLPHSVDAAFLFKAICALESKNYVDKTKFFVEKFVNDILDNESPKDFESDFRVLISGLLDRKEEFKKVVYYLVGEDIAKEDIVKEIVTKLNPAFVKTFFHPGNHKSINPDVLVDYYFNNKDWLKHVILELSPGPLSLLYKTCKKHLKFDILTGIFEKPKELDGFLAKKFNYRYDINKGIFSYDIDTGIFEKAEDLDDYLGKNINYKLLLDAKMIIPIAQLGEKYKTILKKHYDTNKNKLKTQLLRRYDWVSMAYMNYLNIDIVKDSFDTSKVLDDFLSTNDNYKLITIDTLFKAIAKLGGGYKTILKKHYETNKTNLKSLLYCKKATSFYFFFITFKKIFDYDIVWDIFDTPKMLDDYLKDCDNYQILTQGTFFRSIAKWDEGYKTILKKHYETNKTNLKKKFLEEYSSQRFEWIYIDYMNYLNIDLVRDIFEKHEDLDCFLNKNEGQKFQRKEIYSTIEQFGDEHIRILEKHKAYNYFFYTEYTKESFCINPDYIDPFWSKKKTFDVCKIHDNKFYLKGVSWSYLQKFVSIIKDNKENLTNTNRQQSINIVKAIIDMVLNKKNALFYATAVDLAYFYSNISSVDEALFNELKDNNAVKTDVERRLSASSYIAGDLYLFDLFFSLSWCQRILVQRILDANNAQQKIIMAWHNEFVNKLKKQGKGIISGSLLDYIHRQLDYVVT